MIPSLVAAEIRQALVEYVATTFALTDDAAAAALSDLLGDPDEGIFRGPYLWVRPPFRMSPASWVNPLAWLPDGFAPFAHQATAFDRLSSAGGHEPEPTLVTTGTGSGKTECFLYPILDHCARQRADGKAGVKALILYPMNALASDQAGRIAALLSGDGRLAGVRTVVADVDAGPAPRAPMWRCSCAASAPRWGWPSPAGRVGPTGPT